MPSKLQTVGGVGCGTVRWRKVRVSGALDDDDDDEAEGVK